MTDVPPGSGVMAMADVLPSALPLMEGLRADDMRPRHLTAVRSPRSHGDKTCIQRGHLLTPDVSPTPLVATGVSACET
jgi:hypothetical protein